MATLAPRAPQYLLAFLPWLRLGQEQNLAGVRFVPFRDRDERVHPLLAEFELQVHRILSSYIDIEGQPLDNCTIATIDERGWNLADDDFDAVNWAASLLFLCAWARNEYYPTFVGHYVNSTRFRVVWQRFTGDATGIVIVTRRREGREQTGGYDHGKVRFPKPLQCLPIDPAVIDVALLEALDRAAAASTETVQRLKTALPFVELANTDDQLVTVVAEAILMASAFEQMLDADGSKYRLVTNFAPLFAPYGRVTVAEARQSRLAIRIGSKYAASQAGWWVHKKWVEELYDLRSKSVHVGTHAVRDWAWQPHEHLVMAALVFPLLVKLMLEREKVYTLTDDDRAHCAAVDSLLAATGWHERSGGSGAPVKRWTMIIDERVNDIRGRKVRQAIEEVIRRSPGETARSADERQQP